MPVYGTNAATPSAVSASQSASVSSSILTGSDRDPSSSLEDPSHRTSRSFSPDDSDDQSRQRLLGGGNKMTLSEVLYAYDLTLAQLVYQRFGRARGMRIAWEVLSQTGDGILWFLMVLPVVAVMWLAGLLDDASLASKTVFTAFYACNLVDIIAIIVMKLIFKRQRPPHHQNDGRFVGPDQHSFPSGHATRCWTIVAFVIDLCTRHPAIARDFFHLSPDVVRVLIVLWALAISFSRIALGRHYPSDVVAGALIGYLVQYPIAVVVIRHLTNLTDF